MFTSSLLKACTSPCSFLVSCHLLHPLQVVTTHLDVAHVTVASLLIEVNHAELWQTRDTYLTFSNLKRRKHSFPSTSNMTATHRALRSNTSLPQNPPKSPPSGTMAPAAKKRKAAAIERYTCFSCAEDKAARLFPDYNPSPDCEHLINTCKHCLRKWVESQIDDANFKTGAAAADEGGEDVEGAEKEVWGVGCPQCEAIMRAVNVQAAVPKKVYTR